MCQAIVFGPVAPLGFSDALVSWAQRVFLSPPAVPSGDKGYILTLNAVIASIMAIVQLCLLLACVGLLHLVNAASSVIFQSTTSQKYIAVDKSSLRLTLTGATVASASAFDINAVSGSSTLFNLLALQNNQYVCADNSGSSPLIANRGAASTWEQFYFVAQSDGSYALKSYINGKFVALQSDGITLIATASTASQATTFWLSTKPNQPTNTVVRYPSTSSFILQAKASNLYIVLDSATNLLATTSDINKAEVFTYSNISVSAGTIAMQSTSTTGYVSADSQVVANRAQIQQWETFTMYAFSLQAKEPC